MSEEVILMLFNKMTNTSDETKQRPTSRLEEISAQLFGIPNPIAKIEKLVELYFGSDDNVAQVERLADEALSEGYLTKTDYVVLQHRLPFSGVERKTLDRLAIDLGVKSKERIRQRETRTYKGLWRYLYDKEQGSIDVLDRDVGSLPWKKLYGRAGKSAANALIRNIPRQGGPLTVADVLTFFNKAANDGGPLPTNIRGYGPGSLKITYDVFNAVGIELPKINGR